MAVTLTPPLTETKYSARTYYPAVVRFSADGLFAVVVKPLKSINFTDASAQLITMNFKEPPNV